MHRKARSRGNMLMTAIADKDPANDRPADINSQCLEWTAHMSNTGLGPRLGSEVLSANYGYAKGARSQRRPRVPEGSC